MQYAPVFLTLDEILLLQERLITQFGGSPGVRDMGLLQSALAIPQAGFGGQMLHNSIEEMAAAYLFHLVRNHPFVDGNKRIGAAAARVFLLMSGFNFDPPEREYGDLVLDVAAGRRDKVDAIEFFRRYVQSQKRRKKK